MSVKNWDIYSKAGLPTTNVWVMVEVALVFLTVYGNQSKTLRTVGYDFEIASPYSYAMKIFRLSGCKLLSIILSLQTLPIKNMYVCYVFRACVKGVDWQAG